MLMVPVIPLLYGALDPGYHHSNLFEKYNNDYTGYTGSRFFLLLYLTFFQITMKIKFGSSED